MKKRFSLTTTHIIMIGFLLTILTGTFFLSLPISSAHGNAASFWDALFTATTATCVTGLVVIPTVSSWSVFGQVVILLLIQIGGLGVVTIMSGLMIATVYKGNIIKNLIMDCQSYTKYRPNETTGGIFVSWRRKEELPTGA